MPVIATLKRHKVVGGFKFEPISVIEIKEMFRILTRVRKAMKHAGLHERCYCHAIELVRDELRTIKRKGNIKVI